MSAATGLDSLTTFWIGRNPSGDSRLPFLLRIPVSGEGRIYLAARDTWPRSGDVFCYQLREWPADADVVEEVPVEACWRVGPAIHLVLRRRQNRRCLFVWNEEGRPHSHLLALTGFHGTRAAWHPRPAGALV